MLHARWAAVVVADLGRDRLEGHSTTIHLGSLPQEAKTVTRPHERTVACLSASVLRQFEHMRK
jgi:hypothetical protein